MSQSVNSTDLESHIVNEEGGGGGTSTNLIKSNQNVVNAIPSEDMSVCLESGNLLASSINSTPSTANEPQEIRNNSPTALTAVSSNDGNNPTVIQSNNNAKSTATPKNITKLIVTTTTNHQQQTATATAATVLQKVVNSPLITVLNPSVPLQVVKTLCVTSSITSAPQFTLVNTSGPLSVTNTIGKSPTITLLNAPVTVVKAITTQNIEKSSDAVLNSIASVAPSTLAPPQQLQQTVSVSTVENRGHNVFVKNTTQQNVVVPNSFEEGATASAGGQQNVPEMPQSHKLLTANHFPTTLPKPPSNNGQRSKLKILSNVVMPGPSTQQQPNNILLNKTNSNATGAQRYITPRQKVFNATQGTTTAATATKFVTAGSNLIKNVPLKQVQDKSPTRIVYPTHKNQIKTLAPINNYVEKHGIKTLSPTQKNVPPGGRIQRNTSGLRTIPPQRPHKLPNKPNYIGKHAIQAQKVRQTNNRMNKTVKLSNQQQQQQQSYNNYNVNLMQEKQLTFNQALTAEIIETLSCNKTNTYGGNTSAGGVGGKHFEIVPQTRYETAYSFEKQEQQQMPMEEKSKSGLDALSLICQAVLLDHNYNATLPADSPRPQAMHNAQAQMNGISSTSALYSPPGNGVGGVKRRQMPPLNVLSAAANLSSLSSTSSILNQPSTQSILPQSNNAQISQSTLQTYPPLMQQQQQQQQPQDDDAASDISDLSERKHDTEGEETDTAPEAEAVGNNDDMFGDYVTRCICGFLHDDGYMVECDHCKVWQHVQCVVKNKQIPDEYLCEVCDPTKPIDRHKARLAQQHWLKERQFADPKLNRKQDGNKLKELFPKHTKEVSDSDSSDNEHVHNNNVVGKGRAINRRKTTESRQRQQRRDSTKDTTTTSTSTSSATQPQQRRQKRREKRVVKRKTKSQSAKLNNNSDDENNHDLWSSRLPQLHQWIEKYEEAVTNHYSPELRARISSIRVNGAHTDATIQHNNDGTVHKCRIHTQPLTEIKYLVSTVCLAPNTSVIELRGKYMLSQQHRNNNTMGGNCGSGGGSNSTTSTLSTRQNSQRPGPFLFFYRLQKDNTEVCVDTRTYGNSARFIRRSCKPNAELRHCIEKGVLHLYIVTIAQVERNCELKIKHESHDLAAIGTTQIACACGNPDECTVNKTTIKKNGDTTEVLRKRRGRRTVSVSVTEPQNPPQACVKEEPVVVPIVESLPSPVKEEIKAEPIAEIKNEPVEVKPEIEAPETESVDEKFEEIEEKIKKEEEDKSPISTPIATRRSSQYKSDKEDTSDCSATVKVEKSGKCGKKMSREERKLEAILRAIEQMEKADQRKQEHQAKQAHRRESEPNPNQKEDSIEPKLKRRRRKGRARTSSTNASQSSSRRNRLNSTDSCMTSGDEILLSPTNDSNQSTSRTYSRTEQNDKAAVGLLLALSNGGASSDVQKEEGNKSPTRDLDSNSNSAHSSPETQLSSACLLVQAAVEPLESGFKFPKTKKGLMNEWLNKGPETSQGNMTTASSISPSSLQPHITNTEYDSNLFSPTKNLAALAQAASFCDAVAGGGASNNVQARGNAKKRWLRQAISEDHCDSPASRPESPPVSEMVAPPKKRRLPRESLSNEASPPTTPTSSLPPTSLINESCDIDSADNESEQSQNIVPSAALLTPPLAPQVNQPTTPPTATAAATASTQQQPLCLMDPRLMRDHSFNNCEHLVGTVEKTLSLLGFEERRPETITPTKRKLSITEYRQRKKLNNNDKIEEPEPEPEATSTEENNSSESFKVTSRARSGSTSSSTSLSTSDDDDLPMPTLDIATKAAPAFNSEPTELERQREISSLRLKKAFGLPIDNINKKPSLDVETLLSCELERKVKPIALPSPTFPIPGSCEVTRDIPSPPLTFKATSPEQQQTAVRQSNQILQSPLVQEQDDDESVTMLIQDSKGDEVNEEEEESVAEEENEEVVMMMMGAENEMIEEEEIVEPMLLSPLKAINNCNSKSSESDNEMSEEHKQQIKPNMFYTPDEEEEVAEEEEEEDEQVENIIFEETESISYVPPFNNPVYPNSNFTAYTSAMDDDTRYEGRNPSPPPNMEATSYIVDDVEEN